MIINELKLTDFGGHRILHLKNLSNLVGIIGPSGRGKTTVFEAIEFLFRGNVEGGDAMETYIRDYGSSQQAPFAKVEAWITAHGQNGYLTRTVKAGTGKNTRKLEWAGASFTAEAAVAAKLEDLFDIGKKALISQAFQKQGEMYTGLFTTPIAREDYMLKLLNLAHYSGIGDAVSKERGKLLADLPDMTPALDQATYTYGVARQEVASAEEALRLAYDYSSDMASLQELDQLRRAVASAREALAQASSELDSARQSRDGQLSALGVASVDSLKGSIEKLRKEKEDARLNLSALQSQNALVGQRRQAEEQLATTSAELATLNTRLEGLGKMTSADEEARLAQAIHNATRRTELEVRVKALTERLGKGREALAATGPRPVVVDTSADIARAQNDAAAYRPSLDLWDSLQRAGISGGEGCVCPTCKQDASKVLPEPAVITDARAAYDAALASANRLTQERTQQEAAALAWDRNKAAIESGIETLSAQLRDAEADYATTSPGEELETMQTKLANLRKVATQLIEATARKASLQDSKETLERRLATFSPTLPAAEQDVTAATAAVTATESAYNSAAGQLSTLSATVDRYSRAEAVYQRAEGNVSETQRKEALHVLPQMARDALAAKEESAKAASTLEYTLPPLAAALADLSARQANWQSASSVLSKANATAQDAADRMTSIQNVIDKQAQRRTLAARLDRLAKAFGRGGVGSRIAQERWNIMIALTQAYLRRSESPYSIRVSETEAVSVEFMVHKRAGGGWRSMSKMSGGEKMRFAVQFALAAQQLVMPKLGLLALDEPSTHLDEEGKRQLAEVLGSLHSRLQNAEAQVWVVDHSPTLVPALTSKIELPPMELEEPEPVGQVEPALVAQA